MQFECLAEAVHLRKKMQSLQNNINILLLSGINLFIYILLDNWILEKCCHWE